MIVKVKIVASNKKHQFKLNQSIDQPLDLYNHLPFQLAVVTNLLQLNKDASIKEISDLEPREFRVLLNIGTFMPIKAADIAYLGRLDSYTVSRAVKKLIEAKLVVVEPDLNNLKVKKLVLTQKGTTLYYQLRDSINERTTELESVLTCEEKTVLMGALAKIECKAESMIADHANQQLEKEHKIPADQKEIIRWYKKSCKTQR
ncbi:MAG: MarR family transcriptional regulator [Gammaproteobacteria bacterium]|nr:MAG: MarR family transcriptional regulator [Gammaproteobacteria bacterium]